MVEVGWILLKDWSVTCICRSSCAPSGLRRKWLEKAWRGCPSRISQARVEVKKLWLEHANITVTNRTQSLWELKTTHAGWMTTF